MTSGRDRSGPGYGQRRGEPRRPRPEVLIALFAAALILFNFPLLAVWNVPATVLGLPLLPVALFVIWGALIALLACASERRRDDEDGPA